MSPTYYFLAFTGIFPAIVFAWSSNFQPHICNFKDIATTDAAVQELLQAFVNDGLVVIENVPAGNQSEATHSLARLLLPDGHTPLEEAFWNLGHIERACLSDFTTGDLPHIAYNAAEIHVHTDGAYLSVPPRAKLLHVVHFDESHFPENAFVDGIHVLAGLSSQEQLMLEQPLHIRYNDDGESRIFEFMQPVVQKLHAGCSAESSQTCFNVSPIRNRLRIAWNKHDRVSKSNLTVPAFEQGLGATPKKEELHAALSAFESLAEASETQYLTQLLPGRAILIDNWRVLHGRQAYAGGKRRLVGADFPEGALMERWRELTPLSMHADWFIR